MPTSSPTRGLRCACADASRSHHRGRQGGPAPSIELSARSDAADRPVRRARGFWMSAMKLGITSFFTFGAEGSCDEPFYELKRVVF